MKKIIGRQTLLAYPDSSKPFVIHTDASHTQLGSVISQDGKPIAFYSRKLNDAQTRYTTTERELLSIVETLKEFRNILLGHTITVYTDHKNLTTFRSWARSVTPVSPLFPSFPLLAIQAHYDTQATSYTYYITPTNTTTTTGSLE